jgi:hypothetical protein
MIDGRTERINMCLTSFQTAVCLVESMAASAYRNCMQDVKADTLAAYKLQYDKMYNAMLKAKNDLYDAIGGMEEYKYTTQGEEK